MQSNIDNDGFLTTSCLPVGDDGCGFIRLLASSIELLVEFEYRHDGKDLIGGVRFQGMNAHRFFGEMQSRGFIPGSYDTVVEVLESSWREEIIGSEPDGILSSTSDKKHFALFLSSNGYIEVIADSCELLVSREGTLG